MQHLCSPNRTKTTKSVYVGAYLSADTHTQHKSIQNVVTCV